MAVLISTGLEFVPLGTVGRVRTLHTAYRVTDLATSLNFYTVLGYGEVGRIDSGAERRSLDPWRPNPATLAQLLVLRRLMCDTCAPTDLRHPSADRGVRRVVCVQLGARRAAPMSSRRTDGQYGHDEHTQPRDARGNSRL